jgi:hypothetical protein
MNSSKQQKQVMLVLMASKRRYKITDVIRQVESRIYRSQCADSINHCPRKKTPNKKLVSFTRTLKRLEEEKFVENEPWPYWFITNKGVEKARLIKREIEALRDEAREFEFFINDLI